MRALGYRVEWRTLKASDYGAPTIRKRFFLVARCDGLPIEWGTPTHGDPKTLEVAAGNLKTWQSLPPVMSLISRFPVLRSS